MKIKYIHAREIFDSRGWPTVACDITLENNLTVTTSVPSGKSKSSYEAVELRDTERLMGQGVQKAVENIEQVLAPNFIGKEPNSIDMDLKIIEIDNTPDKSRLGANATLALSMAIYKAEAISESIELFELIAYLFGADSVSLPYPLLNIINGGLHAQNNLQIQEFMIVPVGALTFSSAFEAAVILYHTLYELLKKKGKSVSVGDEGGFAPSFKSQEEALDILTQAIDIVNNKYTIGCVIALDVAATQFYDADKKLYFFNDEYKSSDDMVGYYESLIKKYPIYAIEDGLAEDDFNGWANMHKKLNKKIQIIGDDLCATNIHRINQVSEFINSVIIKPNQIGTILETLQAISLCKKLGLNTIISHRSGETEETFIADLAVGSSAGQIKSGACCRSERVAKYNRLLAIEDTLSFRSWNA